MKWLIAPFCLLLIAGDLTAAQTLLSREQLQQTFTGNTAVGLHLKKKLKVSDYYGKNGKFVSTRSNGDKLVGKWWISKKQNVICVRYKHKVKKKYCRTVITDGKGGYSKVGTKTGKVYMLYEKVLPGKLTKLKQ